MRGENQTRYTVPSPRSLRETKMSYAWGAEGSGAPKGNQNALKHGRYTRAVIEDRKAIRALIKEAQQSLREIE